MDLDDEIILMFNDLRIDSEQIKGYNITNIYATSKERVQTSSMDNSAEFIYEIKYTEDIQDGKMETTETD